ncbi:hypothetical protein Cha6605_5503 [Chamaesiphon minutus PCC 6605]|uniref:Uncharacterized protein n=1 Tax=Chamaesiphon minutus (strain ATCC 27169 / PCC 6605) TaxID=1173020 RepID=K9UNY6_CHAP6|nr:hypothetical protein Cha6605_5503 [Chamaesiphon minutus PCC 6605]
MCALSKQPGFYCIFPLSKDNLLNVEVSTQLSGTDRLMPILAATRALWLDRYSNRHRSQHKMTSLIFLSNTLPKLVEIIFFWSKETSCESEC